MDYDEGSEASGSMNIGQFGAQKNRSGATKNPGKFSVQREVDEDEEESDPDDDSEGEAQMHEEDENVHAKEPVLNYKYRYDNRH